MKRCIAISILLLCVSSLYAQQPFSLKQIKSYPFPNELQSAPSNGKWVVAINKNGHRNVFVGEGLQSELRKLTAYDTDDGQELSSVRISADGKWVVYIRGGDFGSNWNDAGIVNPTFTPHPPKTQIWAIPFAGGEPTSLGEGESPVISPNSRYVVFEKGRQLWEVPIDGSAKPRQLFSARGNNGSASYSPDGQKILFSSSRGGHSFIGIFEKDQPVKWVKPSFFRDNTPKWSPDGTSIAFIRNLPGGGAIDSILTPSPSPWKLMRYSLVDDTLTELWESPSTLRGNRPRTHGGVNLNYGNGFISFVSYHDGWPHIYSVKETGGEVRLLTPGNFMVEYVSMDSDQEHIYFSANTGSNKTDIDRRHIGVVSMSKGQMRVLTQTEGNEWAPKSLGSGNLVCIAAGYDRPPLPAVLNREKGVLTFKGEDLVPEDFPEKEMVKPEQVVFTSPDGLNIHATLFKPKMRKREKRPAIIYIHGGPPRQMLLGWHYSSYYSNAYAMNQYLASLGFVVISVNYRLGIGYGYEFQYPENAGWRGASEYIDIKAAGKWLAKQDFVMDNKIGVYGGSYGGFLTAMALGKDSDLFTAGVDIHGVHDRTSGRLNRYLNPDRYERAPDVDQVAETMWKSSPVAFVDTWSSPVLIIHGDDDRNVDFMQSTDLVKRLMEAGVDMETLVIPDDTHHFMLHQNQMKVNTAIAEYLKRKLMDQ